MALQQLQRCLVHVRSDQEELRPCLSQRNDVRILVHERERERGREGERGSVRESESGMTNGETDGWTDIPKTNIGRGKAERGTGEGMEG